MIWESWRPPTLQLVLPPKPLTELVPRVAVDGSIRGTDEAAAEVVRPAQKHLVQSHHLVFDARPGPFPAGLITVIQASSRRRRNSWLRSSSWMIAWATSLCCVYRCRSRA